MGSGQQLTEEMGGGRQGWEEAAQAGQVRAMLPPILELREELGLASLELWRDYKNTNSADQGWNTKDKHGNYTKY